MGRGIAQSWSSFFPWDDAIAQRQRQGAGDVPSSAPGLPAQRLRLLEGAAEALAEHGCADLTVEHVLEASGVSRTAFYENFANRSECLLEAHELAFERFTGRLSHACRAQGEWAAKVEAALAITIDFAFGSPALARLLIVDGVAAEPELVERVLASNEILVSLLRNGREQCPRAGFLPELTERALIGGASSVIACHLLSGRVELLPQLQSQLVQLLLLPYLGIEEARRAGERADAAGGGALSPPD
jgi:AcrR family transcriptional regulator